jgi:hypothetical protein
MNGISWYEQFGFTNKIIKPRLKDIKAHIKQPISIYPEELIARIQDTIDSEIKIEIEPTIPIKEVASHLYECLKTICPERKCPSIDEVDVVKDINSILDKMYQEMLSELNIAKDHFYDLHLILHRRKQKGSSRKMRQTRKQQNKKAHMTSHTRKRTCRHV